jgi:hypothetical protein
MIRFEHGMLVLDNTATKDDVNAVNEFAEFVRNEEQERIVKLLGEAWLGYPPIQDIIAEIRGNSEEVS